MQNTTDKKKSARFWGIAFMVFFALYIALFLFLAFTDNAEDTIGRAILAIYGIGFGATIFGVYRATRQRLKELDSGEEEEARKY